MNEYLQRKYVFTDYQGVISDLYYKILINGKNLNSPQLTADKLFK